MVNTRFNGIKTIVPINALDEESVEIGHGRCRITIDLGVGHGIVELTKDGALV